MVIVLDGMASAGFVELSSGAPPRHGQRDRAASQLDGRAFDVAKIANAYRRAVRQYVPKPYPGRIAVLRSLPNHHASPDLGWAPFAKEIETHDIPGSHLASLTRHVDTTARCIRRCLDAAYRPR